MKLYEYQSKQIFARCGIPIPKGKVAFTPTEVRDIAKILGDQVMVKSQVLANGRHKAGSIMLTGDADEAQVYAEEILSRNVKGLTVQKVLIEEIVEVKKEFYLAITIDRTLGKPVLLASTHGGVEIENIVREDPEAVIRLPIDPLCGLLNFQSRNLAFDLGLRRRSIEDFVTIAEGLYKAFVENDARLVEINPLVITSNEDLIAVDAKIDLDDNALFRHPDLADKRVFQEGDNAERQAYQAGLTYIKLDGNIGCMVNGAGLAMATMDLVRRYGGQPANFLDIGGGASAYKVAVALRILLADPDVKVILFNIFGGITRCEEVAIGILEAMAEVKTKIPIIARLAGTNGEEGRAILTAARIPCSKYFKEAAKTAIALSEGEKVSWAF